LINFFSLCDNESKMRKFFKKKIHVMIVAINTNIVSSLMRNDTQSKSSIENNTNLQDLNITIIN
jgi:hypothetical protein